MPNFVAALKEEIRRLARREIKTMTGSTRRAAVQHRRDIARLKRMIQQQEKRLAALASGQGRATSAPRVANAETDGLRFSARSVRAQRKRLGLSAGDYGKLVGVSGQTVYHWEQGKARPRHAQFAQLIAVRGIGKREARNRVTSGPAANGRPAGRRRKKRA